MYYLIFRFDAELSEELISKAWSHRCCYVVKELLVTERIYVQALGEIIGVGLVKINVVDQPGLGFPLPGITYTQNRDIQVPLPE